MYYDAVIEFNVLFIVKEIRSLLEAGIFNLALNLVTDEQRNFFLIIAWLCLACTYSNEKYCDQEKFQIRISFEIKPFKVLLRVHVKKSRKMVFGGTLYVVHN